MHSLLNCFVLTPKDLGIDKLSVKEIAKSMEYVEEVDDSLPYEFADAVRLLLESDLNQIESEKELSSGSMEQSETTSRKSQFKSV